ncbi:hypothetical protein Tco_0878475 [Tanacetum coccineum]|uniref:Uncharacterized protein n=1 Tax=Tanacetum coccineum TaxID=301880 RepID=A0ABQ5C3E1_9ASTR
MALLALLALRLAKEIGKASRIDYEVVQDQRQQDDNDHQDERQYQPKEEEVLLGMIKGDDLIEIESCNN